VTSPAAIDPTAPGLRIAIVGSGLMARHHARAIPRTSAGARVVAFAYPDPRAQQEFLRTFPDAAPHASLSVLLAAESVDVVHVCTPPATHESLASEALAADCHVYVEKPFAETTEGAKRILDLAARRGKHVCAGHQLLFEAPARRALELLPALGEIVHVESYFSFRPVRTGAGGRKPLRLDLQLLDILPHPVYSLLHLLEVANRQGEAQLVSFALGPRGTLHGLLRRGDLSASLVVSLDGRPVESYLRVVGTNGVLHADFIRGTVQHLTGPGSSMIDKMLNPYRQARQLLFGTTRSLFLRVARRQVSYPGLAEIFDAFYRAIQQRGEAPVSADNIVSTVSICERVAEALKPAAATPRSDVARVAQRVLVTGGTGFLGAELVRALVQRRLGIRVLARREPAPWDRVEGVEYVVGDLGAAIPDRVAAGVEAVVHLAAETAGGFDEHQRNSIDATERILRRAAEAGVKRFIHVSSLAVHGSCSDASGIRESTALEGDARARGPYVWGKVESERLAIRLGEELGIAVKIVRPGAIIDRRAFDPPGRLGRRIGNLFVAVGAPSDRLGIVDREFAASALAWIVEHFDEAPPALNLLSPDLPEKRELVAALQRINPGMRVFWLPSPLLALISRCAVVAQRLLRPGRVPVDVAKVSAVDRFDTATIRQLAERLEPQSAAPPEQPVRSGVGARRVAP
jgi:predicted dehydrogenase/nucleoside-diphosphate-sugar epimerase